MGSSLAGVMAAAIRECVEQRDMTRLEGIALSVRYSELIKLARLSGLHDTQMDELEEMLYELS